MKFSEETIKASRNFCNKIWNINRFIQMNLQNQNSKNQIPNKSKFSKLEIQNLTEDDKWILKRLNETIKSVSKKIENYEFGESARELYEFVWHEYADKYIEASKKQKKNINVHIFKNILKLLHPFIPFITESIWQINYKKEKPLIISEWPK
jgi:valyl-tRNA synthetase